MNMRIHIPTLLPPVRLLAVLALPLLLTPNAALAQSGSFAVSQNGKPVGTASFRLTLKPGGYESTSLVHVDMQGLKYALSKSEELSSSHDLTHVQLSAVVNASAVDIVARPDAGQLLMNTSANGRTSAIRLALHQRAVFLPDFDPGALQNLLTIAAANNNRDLWAIIPKQAGLIAPIQLATWPDEHGTSKGSPIAVRHMVATIAGAATDLFFDPDNQLLQAELPQQGFALVRNGFVLKPPAKPLGPPTDPGQAPSTAPVQPSPQQ